MKLNTILFCIFLTLKLTGHIVWSWWWVFAPFWLPFALFIPLLLIARALWGYRGEEALKKWINKYLYWVLQ